MSTLPNGVDYTIKNYFDHWRINGGVPPILKEKLNDLKLVGDQSLISRFRSRLFGLFDEESGAYFQGMLDDALESSGGIIVPLDNKTKGFPPKETHEAHINQMSAYTLFLRENKIKTENFAYIIHWYFDHKNMDLGEPLKFNIAVEKVVTDPDGALRTFRAAVETLREPLPPASMKCAFCAYRGLER